MPDRIWKLTSRVAGGISRRLTGYEFDQLMALGCDIIKEGNANSICLTFDDGPHPRLTARLLEMLDRHDVKATFFCTGRNAQLHPAMLKEIDLRGHEVANHSMSHLDMHRLSTSALMKEILDCKKFIDDTLNKAVGNFRAPYGHFRWEMRRLRKVGIEGLVGWNIAPYWESDNSKYYFDFVKSNLRFGAIVLLHDCLFGREDVGMSAAIDAMTRSLNDIIPYAKDMGLHFCTVREALIY